MFVDDGEFDFGGVGMTKLWQNQNFQGVWQLWFREQNLRRFDGKVAILS